ncbi:MAG: phospholipase D-like domain-containing protein [Thermoplasmata archaeon]
MQYKFLVSPWKNEFINVISKTTNNLIISSPFVDLDGVKMLSNTLHTKNSISITLVTNLTTQTIVNGLTDPTALLELYKQFGQVKISSLGGLHAKVYLVDEKKGIITSANLTRGGLLTNFEYGVLIDDKKVISIIKNDMLNYYSLGNILSENLLEEICEEAKNLYKIKSKIDKKNTELARLSRESIERIDIQLLKNRIMEGKTINAIFSDTILYLLQMKGPLTTKELHLFIQSIHPDICDDSVDRVINGQHFGKKWKHQVRSAQQFLKRKGRIYLEGGKWYLATQTSL